jgi:hypothetical protein
MMPEGDILEKKSETESILLGSRKVWMDPVRELGSCRNLTNSQSPFLGMKQQQF